jgi:hypothetical protein
LGILSSQSIEQFVMAFLPGMVAGIPLISNDYIFGNKMPFTISLAKHCCSVDVAMFGNIFIVDIYGTPSHKTDSKIV